MFRPPLKNIFVLCVAILLSHALAAQKNSGEQLAAHYFSNGEYDKSAEMYEKLFADDANDFYFQRLLACYEKLDNFSSAEKLIKKRLRQQPQNPVVYVDWGNLYEQKGKRKQAEKHYNTAISKVGYDKSTTDRLAAAFDKIGQTQRAIETYRRAGELIGNPNAYTFEMAQLYEKNGDYQQMASLYFDYIDKYPFAAGQVQILLQQQLTDNNNPEFDRSLKNAIAKRIADNPQNHTYHEMMIWFSLQKKDFDFAMQQAKSIDKRFADDQGAQVFRVASIAASNHAYPTAIDGFTYLMKKGTDNDYYYESYMGLLSARYEMATTALVTDRRAINALLADYETALQTLGKSPQTVPLQRNYAQLLAMHNNNPDKAANILYDIIDMPGVNSMEKAKTKLQLGDILMFSGKVWDASLLYMQVEKDFKNDLVGSRAKFKNAQLSYYNTDFQWAKTQLDVLRASTSKPIANDAMQLSLLISDNIDDDSTFTMLGYFAKGDMLLYQKKYREACQYYDSVCVRNLSHPLFDEILMRKAQIAIRQGQYSQADSLLTELTQKYPADILADDAFYMLATLNEEQLGHPEKALQYYETILLEYPASLYVAESRKKYNTLKNKDIQL